MRPDARDSLRKHLNRIEAPRQPAMLPAHAGSIRRRQLALTTVPFETIGVEPAGEPFL